MGASRDKRSGGITTVFRGTCGGLGKFGPTLAGREEGPTIFIPRSVKFLPPTDRISSGITLPKPRGAHVGRGHRSSTGKLCSSSARSVVGRTAATVAPRAGQVLQQLDVGPSGRPRLDRVRSDNEGSTDIPRSSDRGERSVHAIPPAGRGRSGGVTASSSPCPSPCWSSSPWQ
jgi:hypothetical protein